MTPRVSIILALGGKGEEADRCLTGLAAQEPGTVPFEVVMAGRIGDLPNRHGWPNGLEPRCVDTDASTVGAVWNTGAAAATGEILLFFRADVIPTPRLVT